MSAKIHPFCLKRVFPLLIGAILAGCSPTSTLLEKSSPPAPINSEADFIQIKDLGFTLAGQPFRFVGANSIYFGFYKQYGYSIEDAIRSAKENGLDVLRMYLGFGQDAWGGRPMEEYDRALDIASQHGVRIIAVLTDCCCFGGDWSQTEESYYQTVPFCEFTNPDSAESYKSYIKSILSRKNTVNGRIYRDDPTIMAWDVANEPYLDNISETDLTAWLAGITAYIKSVDPNHLITFGIDNSSSKYDADGPYYSAFNVPNLDFFSIHYNLPNFYSANQHLERIQFRVQNYLKMGKPVILEEFGVGTLRQWGASLDQPALEKWLSAYRNQLDAAFSAGASGALFWGWGVPETAQVPLWWQKEDHDINETAFCDMLKNYQIPDPGSFQISQVPAEIPNDEFETTRLDGSKWKSSISGNGDIRQSDGRIMLKVGDTPATANTNVTSTWQLDGDFDIQIDFEIGEGWSTPKNEHLDGAIMGVDIGGHTYHITRLRTMHDDLLFAWDGTGQPIASLASTAQKGSYQIVRKGKSLFLNYDLGKGMQTLATVDVSDLPATIYFANGSINASQAFVTFFDNFRINFGSTNYLP